MVVYMKKGAVCQEEKLARNAVLSQDIPAGTKRFRSGMKMTQDRISILTRRQKGFLPSPVDKATPYLPKIH